MYKAVMPYVIIFPGCLLLYDALPELIVIFPNAAMDIDLEEHRAAKTQARSV